MILEVIGIMGCMIVPGTLLNWYGRLSKKREEVLYNNSVVIIRKVWCAKATGSKLVTVPRNCGIKDGDNVRIIKVE